MGIGDAFQDSVQLSFEWVPISIVASVFALSACAATSKFDATAESAKLQRRDAEWADLASAGKNVDSIVSYWSDDAVVIEPGQPAVEGKAAVRNFVAESLAPTRVRMKLGE